MDQECPAASVSVFPAQIQTATWEYDCLCLGLLHPGAQSLEPIPAALYIHRLSDLSKCSPSEGLPTAAM